MQFGDMKGFLGLFLMIFSKMFHSLLVPAKQDQLVNGQLGNTALQWHNGKLLALMEGGYPFLVKLCAGVVKSVSEFTFGGSLEHSFTAHPKIDPRTGEMVSFSYGCVPLPRMYCLNFVDCWSNACGRFQCLCMGCMHAGLTSQ